MSLASLPVEILENIFSHLDSDKKNLLGTNNARPHLCALARTCHRFSAIAAPFLYGHITLTDHSYRAKGEEHYKLLNKCCRENPTLVARIRSFFLAEFSSGESEAHNELLGHLAKSTSLTKMTWKLARVNSALLPALYDYASGSFPCLKDLTIEARPSEKGDDSLPAEQLVKLCELPSLENLTIRMRTAGFGTQTMSGTTILSHLRQLHFPSCYPVSIAALESILPRAPNLTCLLLDTVPGKATARAGTAFRGRLSAIVCYDLDGPFRPSFYGELLAPVATQLKSLRLTARHLEYTNHDESIIDLSGFTNLSCLELGASLLFGSHPSAAACPWAQDIWQCLPPRLDELHFQFDGDQGLFWSLEDLRGHSRAWSFDGVWVERLEAGRIDWLLDLLNMKRVSLASFKTIKIREMAVMNGMMDWKTVAWRIDYLEVAARAAGVELDIVIRVPSWFDSPEIYAPESPRAVI
ncbi:hypothetical protein F4677DRAFT_406269 [Hypoxylon crocopeplum]|nr:hypothetical protein F4677DRAFT_406269 [Hypoxylon crocopeplum]